MNENTDSTTGPTILELLGFMAGAAVLFVAYGLTVAHSWWALPLAAAGMALTLGQLIRVALQAAEPHEPWLLPRGERLPVAGVLTALFLAAPMMLVALWLDDRYEGTSWAWLGLTGYMVWLVASFVAGYTRDMRREAAMNHESSAPRTQ